LVVAPLGEISEGSAVSTKSGKCRRPRTNLSSVAPALVFPLALAVVASLSAPAATRILDSTGSVHALVEQSDSATGHILDSAFEATPETTNFLPATAEAKLPVMLNGDLVGLLHSFAMVNLPAETGPETGDFGVEAAAASTAAERGFNSESSARQSRTVAFQPAELGLLAGTRILVRSTFSLSAGLFVARLASTDSTNLTAADASSSIRIGVLTGPPQNEVSLLAGSMSLHIDENGQPVILADGQLAQIKPILIDLSDRSDRFDTAYLAIVPYAAMPYEYQAEVGKIFMLKAVIEARATAEHGNQAAGAFVALVPLALADVLDRTVQNDLGTDVSDTIEPQMSSAARLTESVQEIEVLQLPLGCGGFGLETLVAGMLLTAGLIGRKLF